MNESAPASRPHWAALPVGAALLLYALLCYSAVLTKSATYDEPYHAVGGWVALHRGDFRVDFSNPPIPFLWANLLTSKNSLRIDTADPLWNQLVKGPALSVNLTKKMLFESPPTDGPRFINRARFMMLLLGVMLGVAIVAWSWRLGGAAAAMIAAILFSLDPNLLGHGALVKNDVAAALITTAAMMALWRAGQALTIGRALLLTALMAAGLGVKFSMILLWPIVVLLIGLRALMPLPWPVLGRLYSRAHQKLIAGILLLATLALGTIAGMWAIYRFRFLPTPDPAVQIDPQIWRTDVSFARYSQIHPSPNPHRFDPQTPLPQAVAAFDSDIEELNGAITEAQLSQQQSAAADSRLLDYLPQARQLLANDRQLRDRSASAAANPNLASADQQNLLDMMSDLRRGSQELAWKLRFVSDGLLHRAGGFDPFVSIANVLLGWHVMPSAWINGLMFEYAHGMSRRNFLLDRIQDQGWWYYFALAMLFKTPLATLTALAIAAGIAIKFLARWKEFAWPIACLILPPLVFMAAVMRSNINLGVRHVLPVYPFMYIAAGCLIAPQLARPRWRRIFIGLAILLAIETLTAWPDYIAYFNWACLGPRGGIHLLGDSNLDWGQELPALAKWEHEHGDPPLALAYFGTAEPAAYGVKFEPLPSWPPPPQLLATHVLAVGATGLQGIYNDIYVGYSTLEPTDVLGGSIYLYDLRPRR